MTVVLIPVKALTGVKNRLAPVLTAAQRRALVGAMLQDVVGACRAAVGVARVVLISRSPDVQELAHALEVDAWAEPADAGLNDAVRWGADRAAAGGAARLVVVMGDCPLTMPEDVARLTGRGAGDELALVPSLDGTGTNALALDAGVSVVPRFGPGSLGAHRALAAEAGLRPVLVPCPSLALDVDTPDDLHRLAEAASAARSSRLARAWLARVHA